MFFTDKVNSGGTAYVMKGTLIDRNLIEKHQTTDVAVKVVNGKEPTVIESFKYEVTIMSALPESKYLVRFIGYCLQPMSIIMKNYSMNLQECLEINGFFHDTERQIKAAREIAMGMQIIHSKNVIHFDLKPGMK